MKKELEKDDPNPFSAIKWLEMGAKISTDIQNKLDLGLQRTIAGNEPFFAKAWLSLGGTTSELQQKMDKGLQEAGSILEAELWYDLGAKVNDIAQLKLNEWLKNALENEYHGCKVRSCLAMGAKTEKLQYLLDEAISRELSIVNPNSGDIIDLKLAGANIKPEHQNILNYNLERTAHENILGQFEMWVKLGAPISDEVKTLMCSAAQLYANQNNLWGVKKWIDFGAISPYTQTQLDTGLQIAIRNYSPFSALAWLELGAKVSVDCKPVLNAGLLRAINNHDPYQVAEWLKIGRRLKVDQK